MCFSVAEPDNEAMSFKHCLLAASAAVMWGLNFLAIDLSLDQFPPFFLVALRFGLLRAAGAAVRAETGREVPLDRRLRARLRGLQFAFLYWAMATGMPTGAGLARPPSLRALHRAAGDDVPAPSGSAPHRWCSSSSRWRASASSAGSAFDYIGELPPFLLTVAGAFGWAIGNIRILQAQSVEPVKFTMWMSIIPPLPMLLISLIVEGPAAIGTSMTTLGTATGMIGVAGLIYTVVIATVLGSGIWSRLMSRNPAGVVAPFSMLVPIVGMSAAWLVLGETVTPGELCGAVLVIIGVLGAGLKAAKGARILAEAVPIDETNIEQPHSDVPTGT